MKPHPPANTLCYGDCLSWMALWHDQSVDLIYLDPPYNSNANYHVQAARGEPDRAATPAFDDTWSWDQPAAERLKAFQENPERPASSAITGLHFILGQGRMLAYVTYMAERLEAMRRLLKPTGALCLHCDPTAAAYLKILLDGIFGAEAFRNELVWKRTHSRGPRSRVLKKLPNVHDVILSYAGSKETTRNPVYTDHDPDYIAKWYRHTDCHGRYQHGSLTGPGTSASDSGRTWHGIDPTAGGRHWAAPNKLPGHVERPIGWARLKTRQKLEALDKLSLIYWPKNGGAPRFKLYLENSAGRPMTDLILDIEPLRALAKERLGYPTQKPTALLERILSAFSNDGDLVLDPFCGCGTTIEAARNMNRRWCGVDSSPAAIGLIANHRLQDYPQVRTLEMPTNGSALKHLNRRPQAVATTCAAA